MTTKSNLDGENCSLAKLLYQVGRTHKLQQQKTFKESSRVVSYATRESRPPPPPARPRTTTSIRRTNPGWSRPERSNSSWKWHQPDLLRPQKKMKEVWSIIEVRSAWRSIVRARRPIRNERRQTVWRRIGPQLLPDFDGDCSTKIYFYF